LCLAFLSTLAVGCGRESESNHRALPIGSAASGELVPGVVVPGVEMSAARAAHTATALRDGRVLVAGGFVAEGSPIAAELYDQDAGRRLPLPPMIATRHSHTATELPDGRVLIVGGYASGGEPVASAELFDPKANAFVPTGGLEQPRADHVAVLLESGQVLMVGGLGPGWEFLDSAELYDPEAGRFSPTGGMSVARESHVGVRLADGRVLVAGGHRGRRAAIVLYASAEIYDPATGSFSATGEMRARRHKHDGVLLADGRVLITGGTDERDSRGIYRSTELFDPGSSRFTSGPELVLPRYKHEGSSLLLPSGLVLIAGGAPQPEIFDPVHDRFALVSGEVHLAGQFSAVAPLRAGGALITGGYGRDRGPQAGAWVYRI